MDVTFKIIPSSTGVSDSDVKGEVPSGFPTATCGRQMLELQRPSEKEEKPLSEFSINKAKFSSNHKAIVDRLIQSQVYDLIVDEESRQTMAEALKFARIDTLELAESLNLSIIPPGPIVHTCYAKYRTGLFNGENNPPHVSGLDYVARISSQADRLKEWGIPVILVYLERDMPIPELKKMQEVFSEHENILVMSFEQDLSSLKSTAYYKEPDAIQLLNDPRFSLCREFPEVLSLAEKKAELIGKQLLLHNLRKLGGLSIIYSDIDNTFLRRPMFQLAVYGIRNVCPFRKEFSLQDDEIFEKYSKNPLLNEMAVSHKEIFLHEGVISCRKTEKLSLDTLKERAEILYKYLLSGKALENYKQLEPELDSDLRIFQHESPGYIAVNKEVLEVVSQHFEDMPGLSWKDAYIEKQCLNNQLLNLHGLQQLKQLHIGRDMTWEST